VAIDLLEMPEIVGVDFAQLDFLHAEAPAKLLAMIFLLRGVVHAFGRRTPSVLV